MSKIVLIKNDNCTPCNRMSTWLKDNYPNLEITEKKVIDDLEYARSKNVRSVPTLIVEGENEEIIVGEKYDAIKEALAKLSND